MPRVAVVVLLMLAVFLAGCAGEKIVLPPNEDPAQLLAEIESRGKDIQPSQSSDSLPSTPQPAEEPEYPVTDALITCVDTGLKITATCAILSLALAYVFAGRGTGYSGNCDGVSKAIHEIWAE